jgi:hypothetical protein
MLTSTLTEQMNNQQWSVIMTTTTSIDGAIDGYESAQPRLHQRSAETQAYGTVTPMLPLDLEEPIRHEITE